MAKNQIISSVFHSQVFKGKSARSGQGLIEYLIIVALMGVATIAIVRVLSQTVSHRFASVSHALQGESKTKKVQIDESLYKRKDLGDFIEGTGSRGKEQ